MVSFIQGTTKFNQEQYSASLTNLKDLVRKLNTLVKGKINLVGNRLTLADLVLGSVLAPAFQLVLDSGFRKSIPDLARWFESYVTLPNVS